MKPWKTYILTILSLIVSTMIAGPAGQYVIFTLYNTYTPYLLIYPEYFAIIILLLGSAISLSGLFLIYWRQHLGGNAVVLLALPTQWIGFTLVSNAFNYLIQKLLGVFLGLSVEYIPYVQNLTLLEYEFIIGCVLLAIIYVVAVRYGFGRQVVKV